MSKQVDLEGEPVHDRIDVYLRLGETNASTMAAMAELSEIQKELVKITRELHHQRIALRDERIAVRKEYVALQWGRSDTDDQVYPEDK